MRPIQRFIQAVVLAALVMGCGADPAARQAPPRTDARPDATALPKAPMTAPASVAASPSPIPISSPGPGGFVTSSPPDAETAWTGIGWRKLSPDDPLARVRSITRWRGGYVAVGDLGANDDRSHTPVWTSADGLTWSLLDAEVFGSRTIVAGVGETVDGVVALTVQTKTNVCKGDYVTDSTNVPCWTMTGPVQAWTSSDGRDWAAHRGPNITVPAEVGEYPILETGTADYRLVVTLKDQPLAISRDGIAWENVPAGAFPTDWRAADTSATASGFIVIGSSAGKPVALTSTDGRVWSSHAIQPAAAGFERVLSRLVSGSAGLIAMGEEYQAPTEEASTGSARSLSIWWSSIDGRTWDTLQKYPPLGAQLGPEAQECQDACPDGTIVGNGERMLAYRGSGEQAGWTSFDGRSWQPLAFEGDRPTSEPGVSDLSSVVVLPIGVILHNVDGTTWFGTPIT